MPYLQLGRSHSCRPLCVILVEVELKTSVTCLNIRMQRECVHTDKQGLCVTFTLFSAVLINCMLSWMSWGRWMTVGGKCAPT